MRAINLIIAAIIILCSGPRIAGAQTDSFTKNFKYYKDVATNIDVFASGSAGLEIFDKPVKEARQRLASFLGPGLAKGALIVCSTLEQKDSVNEVRMLKQGFQWILTVMTPEATSQQIIAQMKAQTGSQIPPGMLERIQNRPPEMKAAAEARLISSTLLRMGYAVISTTLAPEKQYRSSRLEDMGRSPLADWLDVGLASYAAGDAALNLRFLQEHLEEGFPLDDLLSMSRPFVAPTEGNSGGTGGGTFIIRIGSDGGMGGGDSRGSEPPAGAGSSAPGGVRFDGPAMPGMRGGGSNMPKDVQDRMIFDCQAAAFFKYAVERLGIEKTREAIQWNREGKLTRDALFRREYMGTDLDQVEKDWLEWVKNLKAEGPGGIRPKPGGTQKPAAPAP